MNCLPHILGSVFINVVAQILLKLGMRSIGFFEFSVSNIVPIGLRVAMNPYIIFGVFCYVLSLAVWLMVLSRVEVSYAYPITSLGYIFTAIMGSYFMGENISLTRIAGILVIIAGVYIVSKS